MARTNKKDAVIVYLMKASLKELQYMENLIKTQKTVKILIAMKTIKTGSDKTKEWTELYKKLPAEKEEWVEKQAFDHLIRIKKWQIRN